MTDIPPTPPTSGTVPAPTPATSASAPPPAAAGSPPASPARATTIPPELARAPSGTVVEGEVRSAGADGRVTVRTEQGEVRLELSRAQVAQLLRPGTPVTIEIRNTTVQPPLVLLTAPGTQSAPPQGRPAPTTGAAAAPPPAVTTGSAAPAPTVPLTVGRIVQATVVPGPAPTTAATAVPTGAPPSPGSPSPGTPVPAATASAAPASAAPTAAPTPPAPAAPAPAGVIPAGAVPTGASAALGVGTSSLAAAALNAPATGAAAAPATGSLVAAVPGSLTPSPAGTPAPGTPVGTSPATSPSTAGATPAPPPAADGSRVMLPIGAVLTVRVAAVAEAAARAEGGPRAVTGLQRPDGSPGAAPTRIAGQIAGLTAAGRPVVQSPVGYLALDARADLRLGTPIALDVLASRSSAAPERSAPLPVLAREWPALDAALRALEEQFGAATARQMTDAMPRPGPQLSATMLFFMSALRGGDVRAWIGRNAAQALETLGRGSLLDALSDDFQTLQRAAEPSENGWRSFLIPVAWDERRPIRLLTRRERRDDRDGRSGKPGTAFLVDLDLTSIGPFRLDGLVRSELLDLLIRTTRPLPAVMRHDIKALFDGTLERTGIVGRLTFRASPVLPPLPVDLDASTAGDTTTVTV